jgi:3D (Asp-Asp-Asp) domain-containing protein
MANVGFVALCTACSLALLGAVPAKLAMNAKSRPAVVKDAAPARHAASPTIASDDVIALSQLAIYTEPALKAQPEELLVSDAADADVDAAEATVAAATIPADSSAPRTHVMRMEVTAYCPCTKCCGPAAQGITASGKLVDHNGGRFVAADTKVLPFGSKLSIPGYADNAPVEVIDRGGAIKGYKLDLYFPTHEEALIWGRQTLDVTVYE